MLLFQEMRNKYASICTSQVGAFKQVSSADLQSVFIKIICLYSACDYVRVARAVQSVMK